MTPRYQVGADGRGACAVWDRSTDRRVVSGLSLLDAADYAQCLNDYAEALERDEGPAEWMGVRSACG